MPERHGPRGHRSFSHDTLLSLGYDWERVGEPGIAPRMPSKVYLPRSTEDVVVAVRETRSLGQRLVVRAHGHSSNDLVTSAGGAVLLTQLMNRIVDIDESALTCTMECGAMLSEVDDRLGEAGLGLPIVGDHADLTAGGFASVGGISPASHRYGLFVDTVEALEYVDWDGLVHRCTRAEHLDRLLRVLAGTGQHGVITTLTVRVIRIDKARTMLANDRLVTTDLDRYLEHSGALVRDPGDVSHERGLWLDVPAGPNGLRVGQFSAYRPGSRPSVKSLRSRPAYGVQRLVGKSSAALPDPFGKIMKYFGVLALVRPPAYASVRDIERFSDKLLDATVGDPSRMFIVLAPAERYEQVSRALLALCLGERERSGALTFVSLYVKAIRSPYLSGGDETAGHCELTLYLGADPVKLTGEVLERLVTGIDDVALEHGAFRYMHTRTSTDPSRRARLDPNARYTRPSGDDVLEDGTGADRTSSAI